MKETNSARQQLRFTLLLSLYITSLKNHFSGVQGESLLYWFPRNFVALLVFELQVEKFPLSAIVNHFELRCQLQQLMLLYLYHEICPCFATYLE